MKKTLWYLPVVVALVVAGSSAALRAQEPSAEVKVGLGIEKLEIQDPSEAFTIAPDTKIYAWTRVTGQGGGTVSISFLKDGKTIFQKELEVPRSPHRTHAYRTFRAGDGGTWAVKVLDKDGKELGASAFTVEIK